KDPKTTMMISKAVDFDFIITNSEVESLIMEANLINKYQPKYNILLKEQLNHQFLYITNEKHPRVVLSRNFPSNKVLLKIGPIITDSFKKRALMDLINHNFLFRKCKSIPKQKCIFYDIGQCLAPCINQYDLSIYKYYINEIEMLFKGKKTDFYQKLIKKEKKYSQNLEYEKANETLGIINLIKEIPKMLIVDQNEFDVFSFFYKDNIITFSIFEYKDNNLISKFLQTDFLEEELIQENIERFIYQYYIDKNFKSKKLMSAVIINQDILTILKIKLLISNNNKYNQIVKLAIENSKESWKNESLKLLDKFQRTEESFEELKKILKIDNLNLIEIYDNSHFYNENPLGVKVAYINGEKRKELYRKYNIKNTDSKSDVAYIYEVILRRLDSIYKNNSDIIPNLIIVDGGIMQVNSAYQAINNHNLSSIINVIGLVKNTRHHTEAIILKDGTKININKQTRLYYLLSNMQDEVHRFAIGNLRNKQSKKIYHSELLDIKGVGELSIKKIFNYFSTIEEIKLASLTEIEQIVGKKIASKIFNYFNNI
ncbi:MAG: excinuclease ABC subunit UvrC, partial [Mycoplasmoidaceae bacterium]